MSELTEVKPQVKVLKVDGTIVQAVNWLDYEGWEIRTAVTPEQHGKVIGFIGGHEGMNGEEFEAWTGHDRNRAPAFRTFRLAVKHLVIKEKNR